MSARTPFVPFNGQPKPMPPPDLTTNGPTFVPNPGNALFHGSGHPSSDTENASLGLDINKPLTLTELFGQKPNRTASHGTPALKNLLQMAAIATLNRPQTTTPSHGNPGGSLGGIPKQPRMSLNNSTNTGDSFEMIMSPVPTKITQRKPSTDASPNIGFKTPALPSQVDSAPPDCSLDLFNAHISNDSHPQRRTAGIPVRQQPSPDPSNHSGSSDEPTHPMDVSGSFRTSTPLDHSHGYGANEIRARRVFQQDYSQDDHSGYYDHGSLSSNRRHTRVRHPNEGDQTQPPPKRQRSYLEPPSRRVTSLYIPLYR